MRSAEIDPAPVAKGARLRLLRRLRSSAARLDGADLSVLRWVPRKWKKRLSRALFARLARRLPPVVEIDGFRFRFTEGVDHRLLLDDFEGASKDLMIGCLRPGDTVVEVGANVGILTLPLARAVGSTGKVYAVEPSEQNLVLLRGNLNLNEIGQVEVLPVAAGAERRRRLLYLDRLGTMHSLHAAGPGSAHGSLGAETVEEVPLDEAIPEPVRLVKIDVEGHEIEVLSGMRALIERSPGLRLLVEWSPSLQARAGHRAEALPERLLALGFRLSAIDETGGAPVPLPREVDLTRFARELPSSYVNLWAWREDCAEDEAIGRGSVPP